MATITNNQAYEIPDFYVGTVEANVDMSVEATFQFTGVDVSAASGAGLLGPAALVVPVSAGQAILGVLQNNPLLAEAGVVMCDGVSKIKAAAAFGVGALLAVTTAGTFQTATSGQFAVGKAMLPSSGAGDVVCAFIHNFGKI
jgi:hypothetical protein